MCKGFFFVYAQLFVSTLLILLL